MKSPIVIVKYWLIKFWRVRHLNRIWRSVRVNTGRLPQIWFFLRLSDLITQLLVLVRGKIVSCLFPSHRVAAIPLRLHPVSKIFSLLHIRSTEVLNLSFLLLLADINVPLGCLLVEPPPAVWTFYVWKLLWSFEHSNVLLRRDCFGRKLRGRLLGLKHVFNSNKVTFFIPLVK